MKPKQLPTLKAEVEDYVYNPVLPINVLFNKINFFLDLTDFAKKPISDKEPAVTSHGKS